MSTCVTHCETVLLPNHPAWAINPNQWHPKTYWPHPGQQHTYFVYCPKLKSVKIGKAKDVAKRMHSLRCGSPATLYLAAVVEGDHEDVFHIQFDYARKFGEWFHAYPSLCDRIREYNPRFDADPKRIAQKRLDALIAENDSAIRFSNLFGVPFRSPRLDGRRG